jgi:hypothetical protein
MPEEPDRDFTSMDAAVTELRRHICALCLQGSPGWLNETVDTNVDGVVVECRDPIVLLGTPCGLEYDIEEIVP